MVDAATSFLNKCAVFLYFTCSALILKIQVSIYVFHILCVYIFKKLLFGANPHSQHRINTFPGSSACI